MGMWRMQGIRMGMRGIKVEMLGIRVGYRDIRVGMQGIGVGKTEVRVRKSCCNGLFTKIDL